MFLTRRNRHEEIYNCVRHKHKSMAVPGYDLTGGRNSVKGCAGIYIS